MTRWVVGILLAVVVSLLVLFLPLSGLKGLVVVLACVGFSEYFRLMRLGSLGLEIFGIGLTGVVVTSLLFSPDPHHFLITIVFVILASFVVHLKGGQSFEAKASHVAFFVLGIFYTGILFGIWGLVAGLSHSNFWVFLMLASTFSSDMGAYLFGHRFGKHKLAPLLSPNKTIEGLIGGVLFSVIAGFITRSIFWPGYPTGSLLTITLLVGFVAPLGDLAESLLKRAREVKDSGQLIPGHGGLLDRVDALLFTGPVVYCFALFT